MKILFLTSIFILTETLIALSQPFPLSKEYGIYHISKCERIGNQELLKFDKVKQHCIHTSSSFIDIAGVKYYNFGFGRNNDSKDYLFKVRSDIWYAYIDSNKVKYKTPLFTFSYDLDCSLFINVPGIFENYYFKQEDKDYNKNDTVLIYDLFYNDNKRLRIDNRGGIELSTSTDVGGYFKRIWVSNKYGIVRFQEKDEGYYVTYELEK